MQGVLVQCYMTSGNIGHGTRFIRVLFSDGLRAVVVTSVGERCVIQCASMADVKVCDTRYKLEAGRMLRDEGGKWVDVFPVDYSARKSGDLTVNKFLRQKGKKSKKRAVLKKSDEESKITTKNALFWDSKW